MFWAAFNSKINQRLHFKQTNEVWRVWITGASALWTTKPSVPARCLELGFDDVLPDVYFGPKVHKLLSTAGDRDEDGAAQTEETSHRQLQGAMVVDSHKWKETSGGGSQDVLGVF